MLDQAESHGFRWRVAVVEDHLLQRQATESIIDDDPLLTLAWSGPTIGAFWTWLRDRTPSEVPHLVLLDLLVERGPRVMPRDIRKLGQCGIRVVVVSALSVPHVVREIVQAGVEGVVSKRDPAEAVHAAVWAVLGGRSWMTSELESVMAPARDRPVLSDQERRTLELYASGMTLSGVAEALNVRPNTAKKYLARVKEKYAVVGRPASSKIDLSRVAKEDGYLAP